jgi:hypothetical protein
MPDSFDGESLSLNRTESEINIRLHGAVWVGVEGGVQTVELPSGNVHSVTSQYRVDVPALFFVWVVPVAEGKLGSCSVELVDRTEPKPGLVIPELETPEGMWTPQDEWWAGVATRKLPSLSPPSIELPAKLGPSSDSDVPF